MSGLKWRAQLGPSTDSSSKEEYKAKRHCLYLSSPYSKLHWLWIIKCHEERFMFTETLKEHFSAGSSMGAKPQTVLHVWRVEFSSGALSSIRILFFVFLSCKPRQLKLMFSLKHYSSLLWSISVGENSWGLRDCYVCFLYLATNTSLLPFPYTLPSKEMHCSCMQSN